MSQGPSEILLDLAVQDRPSPTEKLLRFVAVVWPLELAKTCTDSGPPIAGLCWTPCALDLWPCRTLPDAYDCRHGESDSLPFMPSDGFLDGRIMPKVRSSFPIRIYKCWAKRMGLRRNRALRLEHSAVLGRCCYASEGRNRRRWRRRLDGFLPCGRVSWSDPHGRGPSLGRCWQALTAVAESGHCQRENPTERRQAEFALWRVLMALPLP